MGECLIMDLNKYDGTYVHCSNCKMKKNCCQDFDDEIDNIVTTVYEKQQIINKVGTQYEKHFKKINDEAFNILSVDGVCPFFDNGCTIYDIRPSDCRLFPYDLKEIDGRYYLIRYELPCGSKEINHEENDKVIEVLMGIIKTYTDKNIEEKVNHLKYEIIKEIKIQKQ